MPLEEQLAKSRDRITELLTKRKPEFGDIADAFLNASTGRTTYGEEMNKMKAGRLAEQKTLFDVLSGHKKMQQTDRQLGTTERKNTWAKLQDLRKQGVEDATAVMDSIERNVVNDADRQIVANYMETMPGEDITAINANSMVAKAVGDLAASGKITQKEAQKPSTGMKKVQDENSPTGWSWKSPSGNLLTGAPPPSKGQQITVSPDGTVTVGPPTASQAGKHTLDLEEQRVNVINFAKAGYRLLTDLKESGSGAIGFTGALDRVADSIISQGKAFARRWGDGGKLSKWADEFEWSGALAGESAAVKSQIVSMAYGLALAKNGTRPTDQDVQFALEMLGKSGSVEQMAASIDSLLREAVDGYSTRHLEATGEDWDAVAAFEKHNLGVPGSSKATLEFIGQMDISELNDLFQEGRLTPEEKSALESRLKELGF